MRQGEAVRRKVGGENSGWYIWQLSSPSLPTRRAECGCGSRVCGRLVHSRVRRFQGERGQNGRIMGDGEQSGAAKPGVCHPQLPRSWPCSCAQYALAQPPTSQPCSPHGLTSTHLAEHVAGRERHVGQRGGVPGGQHQAAVVWVCLDLVNELRQLSAWAGWGGVGGDDYVCARVFGEVMGSSMEEV